MKAHIAIVIPCFNQGDTLARAIESALPQCDELVIVDDNSGDDTSTVIQRYWMRHAHKVRFLRFYRRRGVVAARNAAIAKSSATWILPLDADDWLEGDAVQTLLSDTLPDQFAYSGWIEHPPGSAKSPAPIDRIHHKNVAHATFLFSREMWNAAGGYDPDFEIGCEDWAFMLALIKCGYRAKRIDKPLYHRTITQDGRSAACMAKRADIAALLNEKFGVKV